MKYVLIPLVVILFLCSACNKQVDSIEKKGSISTTQKIVNNSELYSYQKYQELFNKSSTGLIFSDAHLIDSTKDTNIVAIDPADSFNTRSFLTLNGDQTKETTQKQLIYKDANQDSFTIIDMIYLKHSLDQDMVSWPSKALQTYQNEQILNQYDTCLIAYRNILVQVTRISKTEPLKLEEMKTKINAVTKYLKKELN